MSGRFGQCGGRDVILAATAALALAGCTTDVDQANPAASPPPSQTAPAVPATPPAEPAPWQVADPVRVHIPAIGMDAPVVPLAIDAQGRLEAPERFDETGWNRDGPEPGEPGTAVIAGHVDSRSGPAVFFRLRELSAGDLVHVHRADATMVTFEVTRLEQHDKDQVPSQQVYGPTGGIELRLVTCGGEFDQSRRSYHDNLIVFARHAGHPDR
jgi:LPXTG-site transpeptidase (sortase) family protein